MAASGDGALSGGVGVADGALIPADEPAAATGADPGRAAVAGGICIRDGAQTPADEPAAVALPVAMRCGACGVSRGVGGIDAAEVQRHETTAVVDLGAAKDARIANSVIAAVAGRVGMRDGTGIADGEGAAEDADVRDGRVAGDGMKERIGETADGVPSAVEGAHEVIDRRAVRIG